MIRTSEISDDIGVGIPVGDSLYVVIRKGKVVREARACGALNAFQALRPLKTKGEILFIKVGGQI